MNESLRNLADGARLVVHKTSPAEIAELLAVADRDLADCESNELSSGNLLSIAYSAALVCAKIALAAVGYRAGHQSAHYWTVQSLRYTLGLDRMLVEQLNAFRKKRNVSDYERVGAVTEGEASEMLQLAKLLRSKTEQWLRSTYPYLLASGD